MKHFESLKLAVFNCLAWLGASVNLADVQSFVGILASLGGLAVSIYTVLYLRKKNKALDGIDPTE